LHRFLTAFTAVSLTGCGYGWKRTAVINSSVKMRNEKQTDKPIHRQFDTTRTNSGGEKKKKLFKEKKSIVLELHLFTRKPRLKHHTI
jgi:hypothetical protein